jgi:RNA polymerase sigma-70 factor (ECF subfamily)
MVYPRPMPPAGAADASRCIKTQQTPRAWNESAHGRRHTRWMPAWEGLVSAARDGDRHAFAALVEMEATTAYRLAYAILGSHSDAEDAAQDAFIRAWRDLPTLRDPARWPAWFRRLAVRAALDRARRLRRHPEITLDTTGETGFDPLAPDEIGPLASRHELLTAMTELSADDRAIIALRYAADLEVPAAAAALGIPLGTAKSRLHRALARLRQRLDAGR